MEAAKQLKKPTELDFYTAPDIQSRVMDPTVNVPSGPFDAHRGSGLSGLLAFGLTEEAFGVMLEMLNITFAVESHIDGSLLNPDILALTYRRNHAHHRLLSLPAGAELSGSLGIASSFYECCRLAALMYATAVLFPLPRYTGVPQRLIKEIKHCVDHISLEFMFGGGSRFIAWVLMLTGIAATGMPERRWFAERLIDILTLESISRWTEFKRILTSFLWMDSACDGGAIDLWDEIVTDLRRF
jgi:hypothetical protein